jgi:hypothetical protein
MLSVALNEITLVQLMLIFLLADLLTFAALLAIMKIQSRLAEFHFGYFSIENHALSWGSFNASLRNLPRLAVFVIADLYYSAQALIDLRVFLLARENLSSMMGVINLVFYKEVFQSKKGTVFLSMFTICIVFQLCFIVSLNFFGMDLLLTLESIVFYASVSTVYGVVQQHWNMVKRNQEKIQFWISGIAMMIMLAATIVALALPEKPNLLTYLSVFNFSWAIMIIFCEHLENIFSFNRT